MFRNKNKIYSVRTLSVTNLRFFSEHILILPSRAASRTDFILFYQKKDCIIQCLLQSI